MNTTAVDSILYAAQAVQSPEPNLDMRIGQVFRPYQIVSLLTMLQFNVHKFVQLLQEMLLVEVVGCGEAIFHESVSDDSRRGLKQPLTDIEKHCATLGLDAARALAAEMRDDRVYYTYKMLADDLKNLRETIIRQLRNRSFMFVPMNKVSYFKKKQPFGKVVTDAFPLASVCRKSRLFL